MVLAGLLAVYLIGLLGSPSPSPPATVTTAPASAAAEGGEEVEVVEPCQPHVVIHSGEHYAELLERPVAQVLQGYRIGLWERATPAGKGRRVGEMIPGSHAQVLEEGPEDYRVRSPLDRSVGWVNKMQIDRTTHQDVNTREACEP